jgi:hypothetical protein
LIGRSSIPETPRLERIGRGVLDAPVKPGHDSELVIGGRYVLLHVRHDGQLADACHAQTARRAILSQVCALVPSGKSDALIRPFRAHHEGRFAIVTNVARNCGGRCRIN